MLLWRLGEAFVEDDREEAREDEAEHRAVGADVGEDGDGEVPEEEEEEALFAGRFVDVLDDVVEEPGAEDGGNDPEEAVGVGCGEMEKLRKPGGEVEEEGTVGELELAVGNASVEEHLDAVDEVDGLVEAVELAGEEVEGGRDGEGDREGFVECAASERFGFGGGGLLQV